jgi:hypothetical protein
MANEVTVNNTESFEPAERGAVRTTIDMTTSEGQDRVFDALTSTEPLVNHLEEDIALTDIVFQGVELTSKETGEIIPATRTVLVDADGNCYSTVSGPVISALRTLIDIKGQPRDWKSPQHITVVERRSNNNNRFYSLERYKETTKKTNSVI